MKFSKENAIKLSDKAIELAINGWLKHDKNEQYYIGIVATVIMYLAAYVDESYMGLAVPGEMPF